MPKETTPEKIEELRKILRALIPALVPAAADFFAAVEYHRRDHVTPVALAERCADRIVELVQLANAEGLLDR